MNIDEIREEKELLIRKLDVTYEEVRELEDKIHELTQKENELDDKITKIICPECNGYGYTIEEDGKILCMMCKGNRYLWARKFTG